MKKRKEGNYYTTRRLYIIIRYIILYGVRRHRSQVTVYTVYTGHRPQVNRSIYVLVHDMGYVPYEYR